MRRLVSIAAVALCCATSVSQAKTLGLLFGVSEYPNLPTDKSLSAPKNDVKRMKQALVERGFAVADFAVLADGVEGAAGLPTRAAILEGMTRLASQAARGDLVIVYGSGHGSRQKSQTGRKLDGLDQLFLPRDTQPVADGAFQNAIVSYEFGERLDAIRRTGADVWFVLDSCFSGSASRAVGDGVHDKMIDPADVGIAVASTLAPEQSTPLAEAAPLPAGSGKLVAFYASQPNETAREVALPANAPLEKRAWGSIFTMALTKVMQRSVGLSYRRMIVESGRLLRADAAFQAKQTPSFEGDGLDLSLPGAPASEATAAWRVQDGILHAGQLEGFEEGAIVSLFDGADVASLKPIGAAMIVKADPLQASIVVLQSGCDPLKTACARDEKGAALKRAVYARLLKPAEAGALKISSPRRVPGSPTTNDAQLTVMRNALAAALAGPLKGRVAIDDASPELITWVDDGGLRFMPSGEDPLRSESGPAVAFGAAAETALGRALLRARQVLSLQRLDMATSGGGARDLSVDLETRRYPRNPATGACAFTPGEAGAKVTEGEPVALCDKMIVTIVNQGRSAIYPAMFFLDDGWNLISRRPRCPVGLSVADRLEPGRQITAEVQYTPRAFGPGRAPVTANGIFIIGVPFREGETDLPNFCGLQAFNDNAAQATRGIEEDGDIDHLTGDATRGDPKARLDRASISLNFWPVKQPPRP